MRTRPRAFASETKVPVVQSRVEIERLLVRHKCTQFLVGVDMETARARVQFKAHQRIVRFEVALPERKAFRNERGFEQAERQRWRALLLVIKAKLEAVENEIATFEQEFLAHIVLPNQQTVGEFILPTVAYVYETGKMPPGRLLTDGTEP